MAFGDTALGLGPFTSGAAKRLVAVSRFSKQLVAVSWSLYDKILFAYKVSSSQALPLHCFTVRLFISRHVIPKFWSRLWLWSTETLSQTRCTHTGRFCWRSSTFAISCKGLRLLFRNSLSLWMCGRLCNLRGAVKRMKPEQPQQLDHHQHSHITCTFSDCVDFWMTLSFDHFSSFVRN